MPYRWLIIIGISIGVLIGCWYFRCIEWADRQTDTMTVYEQMLKNPTAAGKK
jgi:NhaP-type Na+/H+ or K+/H+ antiporter